MLALVRAAAGGIGHGTLAPQGNCASGVYDTASGPGAPSGPDGASLAQGAVSARHTFTVRIPMQIRKRGGRKLIETGVLAFIKEMAPAKKINPSYVGRVLRLTPLAPEIIEAIMEGRQPAGMTTAGLLTGVPVACAEQRALFVDASASDLDSNFQWQRRDYPPPTPRTTAPSISSPI